MSRNIILQSIFKIELDKQPLLEPTWWKFMP